MLDSAHSSDIMVFHRAGIVAAAFVALLIGPAGANAQLARDSTQLSPGSRVRIRSTALGDRVTGIIVSVDDQWLTLSPEGSVPLKLSRSAVSAIELSLGQQRHPLAGLAFGVLTGVAVGFAFPVDPDNCSAQTSNFCSRGEALGGATILFGGIGAIMGTLIKTDRWVPMIGVGPRQAAARGRALEASLTFRF